MGATQSSSSSATLKKEELEQYARTSSMDSKEIASLYKQFRKEAPNGFISRAEFTTVLNQMAVTDALLQNILFHVFDNDNDGVINFADFLSALSTMTRGAPDQKLNFSFRMLDLHQTGEVTKESLTQIMSAFYGLVGPLQSHSGKRYELPEQLVDSFLEQMSAGESGRLTADQYKVAAVKNPDVILGLKLFDHQENQ